MAHPEIFNPVMAKNDDDRRIEWLTFKNINNWTDAVKGELAHIGMVKNEAWIISELLWTVFTCCFLWYYSLTSIIFAFYLEMV